MDAGKLISLAAAVAALCAPVAAQDAPPEERPTSWREALGRFERSLDDLLDEAANLDESPAPLAGIYLPAGPEPEAAGALPSDWTPLASVERPPRRLVLLVHGLDEPGDIWCDLAPALVEAGHGVARFEYFNDQRVRDSATELLAALREARSAGVEEIAIVGHSMGGLVSFDALTREDGYAGDISGGGDFPRVTRLIAVGTPWEGSPWAELRAAAEIREQVQRWLMDESWDVRPLLDYRRDGKGQAGDDLEPHSAILTELASRPTPEGLPLTTIAGRIALAEQADMAWIRGSPLLGELLDEDDMDELVADLGEASRTLGDGAVPLDSALARETEDVSVFEVNHRALIRHSPIDFITGSTEGGPPGIAVILDRLAEDLPDAPDEPAPAHHDQ